MDNWLQVPDNHKLWIDTDIGNDVDDVLALLCCLIMYGKERLIGISTTFYLPGKYLVSNTKILRTKS